MTYFAVTHLTISAIVADLPCMRRPVRKIVVREAGDDEETVVVELKELEKDLQ